MTREEIKTAIKNQIDDQTITDANLDQWIQQADERVQTWRPPADQQQSFDYWDYLKDQKNYTTQTGIDKYTIPENYRAFIELKVGEDTEPYDLIDFRDREKRNDHAVWVLGRFFYMKIAPTDSTTKMVFTFVRISEVFASDTDEPEIETIYHGAYIAFGKSMYYNQQGDTELERENLQEFERIMIGKWRDQELARMATASETASIPKSSLI